MPVRVSVPQLLSDLAADATTIGLDMPGGLYDRLHQFIEQKSVLPESMRGRVALVTATLLASRLVQQQLSGTLTPLKNFAHEITNDTIREEAKRILAALQQKTKKDPGTTSALGALDALWNADESTRTKLLESYRAMTPDEQRQMREQMLCSTTEQLLVLSSLCHEDARTMLAILQPNPPMPRKGLLDSVAETLFPWTRTTNK